MQQWMGSSAATPCCAPPSQLPWSVLGATTARGSWGSSKGRGKAAVPAVCEGLGLDSHSPYHSLKSFRAINGFSCSELANEPAWKEAGTEGLQTGTVEGTSGS